MKVSGLSWRERVFWGVGLLLVVGGIVYLLRSVFAILFTSVVFAYLLDPVVDRWEAKGRSRESGIGVIFGCFALLLAVLVFVVLPQVSAEFIELNLALLPIFTFYLLRDWDRMVAGIDSMIPLRYRERTRRLAGEIDARLGSFVRGQITVCACLAVLYSIGLLISGIDMAIVVGVTAGILFIVPYLGTVVGVVLATALALLKFGFDWHVLAVWGTFGIAQGIEFIQSGGLGEIQLARGLCYKPRRSIGCCGFRDC